jgi:hypothetical protein
MAKPIATHARSQKRRGRTKDIENNLGIPWYYRQMQKFSRES